MNKPEARDHEQNRMIVANAESTAAEQAFAHAEAVGAELLEKFGPALRARDKVQIAAFRRKLIPVGPNRHQERETEMNVSRLEVDEIEKMIIEGDEHTYAFLLEGQPRFARRKIRTR